MSKFSRSYISLLFLFGLTPLGHSSERDELESLSLNDLLNLEMSVASFREETVTQTPAIVSAFTAEQLKGFGVRDTLDLLGFIPGFLMETINMGTSSPRVRGAWEVWGRNILLLIDGVPTWSSQHGQPPILEIPFEAIDRVEAIRGPGAAIYGTNAISGVVNIITKEKTGGDVVLRVDTTGESSASGYFGHEYENGFHFSGSFELQRDSGFDSQAYNALGNERELTRYSEISSALLKLKNDNWKIFFHQFLGDYGAQLSLDLSDVGEYNTLGRTLSIAHNHSQDKLMVDTYVDYNAHTFEGKFGSLDIENTENGDGTYRVRLGTKANYEVIDNLFVMGGVEYEDRSIESINTTLPALGIQFESMEEDETVEQSLFTQVDYTLGNARFLLGGRYVDNEKAGEEFNPRASFVYSFTPKQSLKLLYGQGFSSPSFSQTNTFSPPVLVGNPDLVAETIESIDIAYTLIMDNAFLVVNAFQYTGDNFLLIDVLPQGSLATFSYANSEEFTQNGLEVDFQYRKDQWTQFVNVSYLKEGDSVEPDNPFSVLSPELIANWGGSYQSGDHTIGSKVRYISERGGVDSDMRLDLNYSYQNNGLGFFATIKNITGEEQVSVNPDTRVFARESEDPEIVLGFTAAF